MISCKFCEISKNNFFIEYLWMTASVNYKAISTILEKAVELDAISDLPVISTPRAYQILKLWGVALIRGRR